MTGPSYPYPYDPTGNAGTNLITNEEITVVAPVDPTQANFIVPQMAPFFAVGLIIRTGPELSDPQLVEGVDYDLRLLFVEAMQALNGLQLFGAIQFKNIAYAGTVYVTYQTLGGPFTLPDVSIVTGLARSLYILNVMTWAQVNGLPVAFPPINHPHDQADLTGMADVVAVLREGIAAVMTNNGAYTNLTNAAAASQNVLTVSEATFAEGDVGKPFSLAGGGTNGGLLYGTITGYTNPETITLSTNLVTAITGGNGFYFGNGANLPGLLATIFNHIQATAGAHAPGAVGLGNVSNYATANQTNCDAQTNNNFMTPAMTKYMISQLASGSLPILYRIGDIYTTTNVSLTPTTVASQFGYGTWVEDGTGGTLPGGDPVIYFKRTA